MSNSETKPSDEATAILSCPEGCIEIEYHAVHKDPGVDARAFLNELGPPTGVTQPDGSATCPGCDGSLSVDWIDGDDEPTDESTEVTFEGGPDA